MISYLKSIKSEVEDGIYGRGVKLYLDGVVKSHKDRILDYWREYRVEHNGKLFEVKIPLLHLALSPQKYDLAGKALVENATCSCDYFLDYGLCKHIVAVCTHLDNEFDLNLKSIKTTEIESKKADIFAQINLVNEQKKYRVFINAFEEYLVKPTFYILQSIEQLSVTEEPAWYNSKENIETYYEQILILHKDYDQEKKLVDLLKSQIKVNPKSWLPFWLKDLDNFHSTTRLKIDQNLWELYHMSMLKPVEAEYLFYLQNRDINDRLQLLNNLKSKYINQNRIWKEFVFEADLQNWFLENINTFEHVDLFRAVDIWVEVADTIEPYLSELVHQWVMLLQPEGYDELADLVNSWEEKIGHTDIYEQTLKFLKDACKSKKGLLKKIKALN